MSNFSKEKIQSVWDKAQIVKGIDKNKFRKDCCGAWIERDRYGQETSYGWEVDHVYPEAKGGTDDLINLRPMQWANNRSKSDDYPDYAASVSANGNKNINKKQEKSVNHTLQTKLKAKFKI